MPTEFKWEKGELIPMTDQESVDRVLQKAARDAAAAAYVPPELDILKFRRALKQANALALFRGYLLDPTTSDDDKEYWQFTKSVKITDPELERARVGLGIGKNAVSNLFKNGINL